MASFSQSFLHFAFLIIPLVLQSLPFGVSPATLSITTDKEALLSFKSQLNSNDLIPHPLFSWNQNSSSPCNWTGVFCNNLSNRVVGLELSGLKLSGHLSPHIGNLTLLKTLQLQDNQFTGPIPDEICNLSRLRVLNLSSNSIEGVLPSNVSFLTNLEVLEFSYNEISGRVPDNIAQLAKLKVLKLGGNKLYGEVPSSLGNISFLTNISLGTNNLGGRIPDTLGQLKNLIELDLTINNLTGIVPPSIYNLTSLVNLALAANNLWGEFPQDVSEKLPKLLIFNVCINKFTGRIPGSLHNLTNIRVIRMFSNLLEGTVPPGLGNLPFLRHYDIGHNRIVSSGDKDNGLDFITSLTNSTQLNFLDIHGNQLEGVIPESVGNLSKVLSKLFMGKNRIHGKIPGSIRHLSGLSLLGLSHSSISGEIPDELGQLEELQKLSLAGNQISGGIPKSLGNLKMLSQIDLSNNELVGEIPTSFENFQNMLFMDLSNNKLNGSIPKEILNLPTLSNILNLSHNLLSGSLPQEVGDLIRVATIDFSNNLLSNNIPGSVKRCLSLEKLFLARNMLSGPIPQELGDMKGLETLDLSSNQLSGSIPVQLQNLHALQFLNLSYNNLEGAIPSGGVFLNLSAVHLEGNSKLCLHFPCMRQGHGKSIAKIFIITTIVVVSVLIICLSIGFILYIKKKKTKAKSSTLPSSDLLKPHPILITYDELRCATADFSQENLIGSGSFGSVYRGNLISQENSVVAVKVLDASRSGSLKSFFAECEAVRNTRHRNLVKLITSCSSIDFKSKEFLGLIYEFMCNGSLDDWIKGKRKHNENGNGLNLLERLNIAIDVGCALEYLHNDSEIPIVHCDLKPTNILLDEDMTAKVGDFGLARLIFESSINNQVSISSTHVLKGSIGYIPPEYGWGQKPSVAGDVYSFGIVVLELFSGKSPTEDGFNGTISLTRWVQSSFPDNIVKATDPQLLSLLASDEYANLQQLDCLVEVFGVGLSCAADSADARISMRDAVGKLKAARDTLLKPIHVRRSPASAEPL